eukprot:TRINITY_DN26657_c0_g1_i1.p1 TRINITY_DN26657_c0_g1~~TRINITY_DN26657_c0_g1_i1.p1  ORF type:complete len:711 (+),score=201.50 TRINITY_DN26657_c0_g1_i1:51-2135(+)
MADAEALLPQQAAEHADLHDTFLCMRKRGLNRELSGTYGSSSSVKLLFVIATLVLLFGSAVPTFRNGAFTWGSAGDSNTSLQEGLPVVILTFLSALLFLYMVGRIAMTVLWSIYWVLLAVILKFIVTGSPLVFRSDCPRWLYVGFAVAEGLTFGAVLVRRTYPHWLPCCGVRWWGLRPLQPGDRRLRRFRAFVADAPVVCFTYRSSVSGFLSKVLTCRKPRRRTCVYRGAVKDGKPHGIGRWVDSSYHGECLIGYWHRGEPRAPFRSREYGSGFTFAGVLVGYFDCSCAGFRKSHWFPRHGPLKVGVASVECSVSGQFYSGLPRVEEISPSDAAVSADQTLQDVLRIMEEPEPDCHPASVTLAAEPGGGCVVVHPGDRVVAGPRVVVELVADRQGSDATVNSTVDPVPVEPAHLRVLGVSEQRSSEVVLLVPGYNCPAAYGMGRIAQLVALGNFPARIRPFVFAWPGGRELTFFQAKKHGAEAAATTAAFRDVVQLLQRQGITDIHVLAHSMGARCLLSCVSGATDLFTDAGAVGGRDGRVRLRTATLLNPETDLSAFVADHYPTLRSVCDHITVYADADDGALFYAEAVTGKPSLGRAVFKMRTTDEGGEAGRFLDIDVIDTTWIDANVHGLRHAYFELNAVVIDDLREIVTTRRRARHRRQLVQSEISGDGEFLADSNVYNFMVAPTSVKNA